MAECYHRRFRSLLIGEDIAQEEEEEPKYRMPYGLAVAWFELLVFLSVEFAVLCRRLEMAIAMSFGCKNAAKPL